MSMKPPSFQMAAPVAPPPPPSPAMYGEQMRKGKPQQTPSSQFTSSVIGSLPTQTAQKSLLG
jgi:hypothetical protein